MNSKYIYTIGLLLLFCGLLSAQVSLERQVFTSMGGFSNTANLKVSDSAGETIVKTVISGNVILTQGFQQVGENEITGIEDFSVVLGYKIYPNPTIDLLTVELTLEQNLEIKIEMMDLLGRSIPMLQQHLQGGGVLKHSFSLKALVPGTYIVAIKDVRGKLLASHKIQKLN